jgi:glucose/arabinose dehydrogenase
VGRAVVALLLAGIAGSALAQQDTAVRTGAAAFGDWRQDAPGVRRLIRPEDMPAAYATPSKANFMSKAAPASGTLPSVPAGFKVDLFATLEKPRQIRVAPNGDLFVAETAPGRIRVLRAADGSAKPSDTATFAEGLDGPFGIAFYPPGADPQFVYVANEGSVVRFPYRSGDLKARGPAETIVPKLPVGGGHVTRDLAFSPDGGKLYISVGSETNDAESMDHKTAPEIAAEEKARGLGASWSGEAWRADVVVTSPDGKAGLASFANGIRNCVSLVVEPHTSSPWCVTNERDALGDDLPPDYATSVTEHAFYGWPWFYIGDHEDPRHKGERADLAGKITVPDVLIQPHSAPLGLAFYTAGQFPAEYKGSAFVALHGSWNRANRTGYKVVRLPMKDGKATGAYEDFMTGLVTAEGNVWGRPVGVAVAHDGALLVTDDLSGAVWRVSYAARQ